MKRNVKIMLAVMLVMTMVVPMLSVSAATVTTNKGYVLVEEDFSAVTDHSLVSVTRDADGDDAVDTAWTKSTSYPIGDSDWVFRTNSSSSFPNNGAIDAYVGEDGKLYLKTGGSNFYYEYNGSNRMSWKPTVLYNGDYSKVGDNFKISFDFTKKVKVGGCIKFMVNNGVASYYALNFESGAGKNLWNLYKVENNGQPAVLTSSTEIIETYGSYNDSITSGNVTILYDNGRISWEINGKRYDGTLYSHTGTYLDNSPFVAKPSECTFGFSTNQEYSQYMDVDNIKFSYSIPDISEDFSGEGITEGTAFANSKDETSVRTNITGTDFCVTTRREANDKRLSAKIISGKLNIFNQSASVFKLEQRNKLDFVEYRGAGVEGVGEKYVMSFDYSKSSGRTSGYFFFGLENTAEDDYEYTDYYVLAFAGEAELNNYVDSEQTTGIPGWEIKKMTGGDTWNNIIQSDYTFNHDKEATLKEDGSIKTTAIRNSINAYAIKSASVTVAVDDGVATVTVDHDKDGGTPDVKTFNIGTTAGKGIGFSTGSIDNDTANFDNIVLTADKKAVEPIEDKVYIYGGKFAQKGGVLVFEVPNGQNVSYTNVPVTLVTHEQATANIPEGATKAFFWNNFENLYPLNGSVSISQ